MRLNTKKVFCLSPKIDVLYSRPVNNEICVSYQNLMVLTDRQTCIQTDIHTDWHTDRQTYGWTDRLTYGQTDIRMDGQTYIHTYWRTDRHTDGQSTYTQYNAQDRGILVICLLIHFCIVVFQEFMIGKTAAKYVKPYHNLYHFKYNLFKRCQAKVGLN